MKAEFEEKTYETAANVELANLSARCPRCGSDYCLCLDCENQFPDVAVDIWAPGQVLEGTLGFDVLAHVEGDPERLNAVLPVALPAGFEWKPFFADPDGAGSAFDWASLFIQYKRPERMFRRWGEFKKHFTGRYFRFELDPEQHQKLVKLRAGSAGCALVCYAAPRFHTNEEMYERRTLQMVLSDSVFIEVDDKDDHQYGAYDSAIAGLFSEPTFVDPMSIDSIIRRLGNAERTAGDTTSDALQRHLLQLAAAAGLRAEEDAELQAADFNGQALLSAQVKAILDFAVATHSQWYLCSILREA